MDGQPVRLSIDTLVIATSPNLWSDRQEIRASRTGSGPTKKFTQAQTEQRISLEIKLSSQRATLAS